MPATFCPQYAQTYSDYQLAKGYFENKSFRGAEVAFVIMEKGYNTYTVVAREGRPFIPLPELQGAVSLNSFVGPDEIVGALFIGKMQGGGIETCDPPDFASQSITPKAVTDGAGGQRVVLPLVALRGNGVGGYNVVDCPPDNEVVWVYRLVQIASSVPGAATPQSRGGRGALNGLVGPGASPIGARKKGQLSAYGQRSAGGMGRPIGFPRRYRVSQTDAAGACPSHACTCHMQKPCPLAPPSPRCPPTLVPSSPCCCTGGDIAPPPAAEPPSPTTGSVKPVTFAILLTKDPIQHVRRRRPRPLASPRHPRQHCCPCCAQWETNMFNKSSICDANASAYKKFCAPGQERIMFFLPDNPSVPIANIAGARDATFVFSLEAVSAVGVTFTEYIERAIKPLVLVRERMRPRPDNFGLGAHPLPSRPQNLEKGLKPPVTEEEKLQVLYDEDFWAILEPDMPFLKKAVYEKIAPDTLRSHLLAHDLPTDGGKAAKISRLLKKAQAEENERQEAISKRLETVHIDSDPSWRVKFKVRRRHLCPPHLATSAPHLSLAFARCPRLSPGCSRRWQISMALQPGEQMAGEQPDPKRQKKATDYTAKRCMVVWEPGAQEPQTSIAVAQRVSKLLAQVDHSRNQRLMFLVHWARELTTA